MDQKSAKNFTIFNFEQICSHFKWSKHLLRSSQIWLRKFLSRPARFSEFSVDLLQVVRAFNLDVSLIEESASNRESLLKRQSQQASSRPLTSGSESKQSKIAANNFDYFSVLTLSSISIYELFGLSSKSILLIWIRGSTVSNSLWATQCGGLT